jgi:uncharacterized membrane-anchored protein
MNHAQPAPAVRPRSGRSAFPEPVAAKVPEITALFWVIKLITTFMGEATSDFLGDVSKVLGAGVEVGLLVVAVWIQFRTRQYHAVSYWLLAVAIAVSGTGASDTLHIAVGIPYAGTTVLWAVVLAVVFWRWQATEGTLSIHSIVTRRRETFYWCTVFATFALGTALGDFTASVVNLGYGDSGILFAVIFVMPLVAWRLGLNSVAAFWWAYVVTRPLGASFADYTSKSHHLSGLNAGDGPTALASGLVLLFLVGYVAIRRRDIQPETSTVT